MQTQYAIFIRDREGRLILSYVEATKRDAERTLEYLRGTGHKVELVQRQIRHHGARRPVIHTVEA